jgi:hypothetical protein
LCSTLEPAGKEIFVGEIVRTFTNGRQWGVRKLMFSVLAKLAGQGSGVVKPFLPAFVATLTDPIPAVVIAALRAWAAVRSVVGHDEDLRTRIAALSNSPNEEIRAVWEEVGLESARGEGSPSRTVTETRLPRLAASKSANIQIIGDGHRWNSASGLTTAAPPKVMGRPPPGTLVRPKKRTYGFPILHVRESGNG